MNITIEDEGREIQDIQSEYIAGLKKQIADLEADLNAALDEVKDKDKRIAELEAEKAGYRKAAEYWKKNYDRLIGRSDGFADECPECGSTDKLRRTGTMNPSGSIDDDTHIVMCNNEWHTSEGGGDDEAGELGHCTCTFVDGCRMTDWQLCAACNPNKSEGGADE